MIKDEREKNIKGFNKDLCKLLDRESQKDIDQVYEDTRYAGI